MFRQLLSLNSHDCSHTITHIIWRSYVCSGYRPRTITNATSDVSIGNLSNDTLFRETSGRQSHSISDTRHGAWFVTDGDYQASSAHKLLPLNIASLVNYHIEIGSGRSHGDSSCVTRGVDSQIGVFDDVSWVNAICTYFVPCQLFVDFSDKSVRCDDSSGSARVLQAMGIF